MELLCPGLRDKVRQLAEAMGRREDGRVSPYGDTANVAEDVARAMGCLMRSEEVQRCFTLEGLAEVMVYSRSYGYVGVLIKGDKAS